MLEALAKGSVRQLKPQKIVDKKSLLLEALA